MAITRMGKISAVLVVAMLISACGANIHGGKEKKIAVVNWDKAQAEHPQYTKLEKGEKILKDLLLKRKGSGTTGKGTDGKSAKIA